jgi:hypothetical protein
MDESVNISNMSQPVVKSGPEVSCTRRVYNALFTPSSPPLPCNKLIYNHPALSKVTITTTILTIMNENVNVITQEHYRQKREINSKHLLETFWSFEIKLHLLLTNVEFSITISCRVNSHILIILSTSV